MGQHRVLSALEDRLVTALALPHGCVVTALKPFLSHLPPQSVT